ncbi:MAG: ATP phosphoribosyltransferase [Clostridia bacterium]|nr:ATP phosphoribosyltransferase [Clostridia bacterium]
MTVNDKVLQKSEKITFALRELFVNRGFERYRMSKFEEYDLYAKNKDFLISDNVITFTEGGRLMALKPDVTLSIIKNGKDSDGFRKLYYNENVFRFSKESGVFREMAQVGVECIGDVDKKAVLETVKTARESLSLLSGDYVLALSNLDIIKAAVCAASDDAAARERLYEAVAFKNRDAILSEGENGYTKLLKDLLDLHGSITAVLPSLEKALAVLNDENKDDFLSLLKELSLEADADKITVDFSVTGDMNYYNGTVFKGYIGGVADTVLSGGRYDNLMKKMGRASKAIGFAVYTDKLDVSAAKPKDDGFVNIAVPKGRLGEKVFNMFTRAGIGTPDMSDDNRKLIFENRKDKVRFFWVKPTDVAKYVEKGAADIGVAGKDILLEYEPEIYELADLKIGKCRMAAAAPAGYTDDPSRALTVATKFENIARKYYRTGGRDIEVIKLNGSIEVAPILGISDVIVDIVETGTTLKENNLEVIDEIAPISARLIANRASYGFKSGKIEEIANKLLSVPEDKK